MPIEIPRGMTIVEIKKLLTYGAHSSVVKEKEFFRKELSGNLRAGNVDISPL